MVFCQRRPGTVSSGAGSNTLMRLNNNAATRTLQQTPTAAASSAFSSPHRIPSSNNGGVILKLVIVNDTKDAVDSIIRQHVECYHRSGGQEESYSRRLSCHLPSSEEAGTDGDSLNRDHAWCLLAVVDKFPFTDGGYNLSVSVEQISIGWRCPGHFKYQELNFQSIWSSSSSAAPHSCLFHFDQVDPTRQFLSCKMIAYQHCYNRRQIINIATDRPLIESYEFPPTNAKLSPFRTLSIRLEPFKLSSNMRKSLSRLLDPTVANQSNWKDLALRLGVESRNVPFYGAMKSPTEGLLDLWEAQYHEAANIRGNLDALKDALKAIGRIDAVLLLDETAVAAWI